MEDLELDKRTDVRNEIAAYRRLADKRLDGREDSLLHRAVKYCYPLTVKKVLNLGVNVNATNGKRQTPLHYAAQRTHHMRYIIEMLFENNTSFDVVDQYYNTALHYLVANPEVEMFSLFELFRHKLNPNIQNRLGKTPLHVALENEFCRPEHINFLDLYGANFHMCTSLRNYPLHCAVQRKKCTAELLHVVGIRSQVNAVNSVGDTPLLHALRNPRVNLESIKELLNLGAEVNVLNEDKVYPMCQAVIYSCPISMLDLLYFKGAKLNQDINIVEKAIEIYNDEPSREKMNIIKTVIRLMMLESMDYNVIPMIRKNGGRRELYPYPAHCVMEICEMQDTEIGNDIKVWDILLKKVPIQQVWEDLMKVLTTGKFPLYRREFGSFVERTFIESELQKYEVHNYSDGPNSGRKITLYHHAVCHLLKYLPDDNDVFTLLVAYYPFKYPPVLEIENDYELNESHRRQAVYLENLRRARLRRSQVKRPRHQ